MHCNLQEEFGGDASDSALSVEVTNAVLTDGRMQPHEWLITSNRIIKTDAVSHGDDHFYPGPTDIAWDLAGAIIEWQMEPAAQEEFLSRYESHTGDDPRRRLPGFLQAYAAFRMGFSKMAAEAMQGTSEEARLSRDYVRYRAHAASFLRSTVAA